jgi:hypothetical protein
MIEDWFLALDSTDFDTYVAAVLACSCVQSRRAKRFYEMWLLRDWVAQENAIKGSAPRGSVIADPLLRIRRDLQTQADPPLNHGPARQTHTCNRSQRC